jgi:hypothetical protein
MSDETNGNQKNRLNRKLIRYTKSCVRCRLYPK